MKHNIRVSGKFATKEEKAISNAKKYRDVAEYYQSIISGHYRCVRQLTEENKSLKDEVERLKCRVAAISTENRQSKPKNVQTIRNDIELKIEPFMCEIGSIT